MTKEQKLAVHIAIYGVVLGVSAAVVAVSGTTWAVAGGLLVIILSVCRMVGLLIDMGEVEWRSEN